MGRGQDIYRKLSKLMPSNEEKVELDKEKSAKIESEMVKEVHEKDKLRRRRASTKKTTKKKKEDTTVQQPPTTPKPRRKPLSRNQQGDNE